MLWCCSWSNVCLSFSGLNRGVSNGNRDCERVISCPVNPSTSPLVFKMVPGATAPSWDQDGCSYANEGSASGTRDASGNPTLATLSTISPVGVASTNPFGTASLVPGPVAIIPSGIASTSAFGTLRIAGPAIVGIVSVTSVLPVFTLVSFQIAPGVTTSARCIGVKSTPPPLAVSATPPNIQLTSNRHDDGLNVTSQLGKW